LVEAKNNQLPSLKVSASYLHLFSPNVNLKTGGSSAAGDLKINDVMYGSANLSIQFLLEEELNMVFNLLNI
jgi:hypothetical protein